MASWSLLSADLHIHRATNRESRNSRRRCRGFVSKSKAVETSNKGTNTCQYAHVPTRTLPRLGWRQWLSLGRLMGQGPPILPPWAVCTRSFQDQRSGWLEWREKGVSREIEKRDFHISTKRRSIFLHHPYDILRSTIIPYLVPGTEFFQS